MADKKISQLTSATLPLAGTELVPVVQSGATVKVSVANLSAAAAYTPAGVGAVVTTVQTKLRESVSVKDFGAVGDGVTDDTLAIVAFHSAIKAIGSNVRGVYPPGVYVFSPQNHYSSAYAWRFAVELVDVHDVTIEGYGATLKQVIPSGWVVNATSNYGNEEGAIQFRSFGNGTCYNINILGLNCEMQKLTYSSGTGDGASMGIALRGVVDYRIEDCTVTNSSTDGIYCGPTYSSTYGGAKGHIVNCYSKGANRNALSIVQNSKVRVIGGRYADSSGGSYQAGIDLEPDAGYTQSDIVVIGAEISGNGLRGLASIRTSNAIISNCVFGNLAKEISIEGASSGIQIQNNVFTLNSTAGLGIDISGATNTDITIDNNRMYMPAVPNYFIRIGFGGVTGYKNFYIRNNTFVGESGLSVGAVGGLCEISGNAHDARVIGGSVSDTNVFSYSISATNCRFTNNNITIDSSLTWTGTQLKFALLNGWAEGNKFISHAGAIGYTPSRTTAYPVQYGKNEWSTYFYYDELLSSTAFRVTTKGYGISYEGDGVTGSNYGARVVIGGFARTTNVNAADNQVGDVAYNWVATTGNPLAYRCTVAGVAGSSAGTWVGLFNKT
jgi:hypothetical protein